ncbi:MAG: T9SS type A sorting domain-containing protein [Bacteroidetes bacterium]|nr:T9SS type A sorting domain-containing protein [Bacteroidota bacterium]
MKAFNYKLPNHIKASDKKIELIVSPNPTNGKFTVQSNNQIIKLEVIDFYGKTISLKTIPRTNIIHFDDLPLISAGTFILKIYPVDGSISNEKLILKTYEN